MLFQGGKGTEDEQSARGEDKEDEGRKGRIINKRNKKMKEEEGMKGGRDDERDDEGGRRKRRQSGIKRGEIKKRVG